MVPKQPITKIKIGSKAREENHESTVLKSLNSASQDLTVIDDDILGKVDRNIQMVSDPGSPRELIMDSVPPTDLNQEVVVIKQNSTTALHDVSTNNQQEMVGHVADIHIGNQTMETPG